jgi:2-polyprenyl-3-methyl-5-hydroxy-6-metoxy-1,4-benzoquinol methylase
LPVNAARMRSRISYISARIREEMLFSHVYRKHILHNARIPIVLNPELIPPSEQSPHERDWPGNPRFQSDEWWKTMLLRYALAMHYGKGKSILDSCCGIGWGAFLLDAVASRVVAVDNDARVLKRAKSLWPGRNIEYVNASVLDLPLPSGTFDLVTAMESIEHFPEQSIDRYLLEVARMLKPGGIVIGSSLFPETTGEAEAIRARNPHHLHILTRSEMNGRLIDCGFVKIRIFTNRHFFFARKKRKPPCKARDCSGKTAHA